LLALTPAPLFRNEYSASGGEDYDLFRRVRQSNGRIAWCDEAVVFEPTPESRLSIRRVLSRYYTTGIYMSQIDRFYDGTGKTYKTAFKGFNASLLRTITAGFRRDSNAAAQGMLSTAHYAGRAVGLLGGRAARYT
jgi:cellulose synthase/poly-beta-1,6-N-acetylglucosamine synthase-like glycosyltransferase